VRARGKPLQYDLPDDDFGPERLCTRTFTGGRGWDQLQYATSLGTGCYIEGVVVIGRFGRGQAAIASIFL
jgi:hypothetical protein